MCLTKKTDARNRQRSSNIVVNSKSIVVAKIDGSDSATKENVRTSTKSNGWGRESI